MRREQEFQQTIMRLRRREFNMPYESEKQERLMQAVAHNPQFAKKVGIPQSVGQKFEAHEDDEKRARVHALRGGRSRGSRVPGMTKY